MAMYRRFAMMLLFSYVIMYAAMYVNVSAFDHIYLSTTRMYMAFIMVCPMALLMLGMMRSMYNNRRLNSLITVTALLVLILAIVGLRTQAFIADREYMRGMISHHSSAILTSSHATITTPAVKKLADGIIASQQKEIAEMQHLLDSLGHAKR